MAARARRRPSRLRSILWALQRFLGLLPRPRPFPTYSGWTIAIVPLCQLEFDGHLLYPWCRYVVPGPNALHWLRQGVVRAENIPGPLTVTTWRL